MQKKKSINDQVRNLLNSQKYYVKYNRNSKKNYEVEYHSIVRDPDGKLRDLNKERKYKLSQLNHILKFLKHRKPGKILDVGCGHGWMLSAISKRWKKFGLDISHYASKSASRYANIFVGNIEKYPEKNFDVITALHIIEHLHNPDSFIKKVKKLLKKNGILILETPDFDSAAARRYKEKFRLLFDKTHVSLFSQDSLIRFVRKYGFKLFNIEYPYLEGPFFNKKNLLNFLNKNTISPPFYGSVITLFLKKK